MPWAIALALQKATACRRAPRRAWLVVAMPELPFDARPLSSDREIESARAAERGRQVREGLRCLQLSGAIFLRAHLSAPWAYDSPAAEEVGQMLRPGGRRLVLFHIFTEGQCRLELGRGGGAD